MNAFAIGPRAIADRAAGFQRIARGKIAENAA